jgi:probable LLM family oxidoreductase
MFELGISTFGDVQADGTPGRAVHAQKRAQELMEEVKLADEVGLDVFAFGEHHRPDFVISAPEVFMAAAATITKNIRLSSAVTVLSSADPVRTYQNFATVDLLSNGRAEMIAGRGSFIESFPLFGYNLDNYDELFTEKLELLLKINEAERVSWKGKFRASISDRGVYPRTIQPSLPIWIGVGGTYASAVRAGKLNLPMALAILGGPPDQFVPFVNAYRQAAKDAGHDVSQLPLAIHTHFHIAENAQQAADDLYPSYAAMMNRIGRERGWSPLSRPQFDQMYKHGPLIVGDPSYAIDKILAQHEVYKTTRYIAHLVGGHLPHEKTMKAIELYGTKVAPAVRKALQK